MPYTYKALTLVWLTLFGLAALSGSGVIAGSWVLLLVGAALVMPALTLTLCSKPRRSVGAIASSQGRALAVPATGDRSPMETSGINVANDGGARPTHVSGGMSDPVSVVG